MTLRFVATTRPGQVPTYGATQGDLTFVITLIENKYHASAKHVGAKMYDGTREELGYYDRFLDAAKACEDRLQRGLH